MKNSTGKPLRAALFVGLLLLQLEFAFAQFTVSFEDINKPVPDGNPAGVSDTQTVTTGFDAIASLALTLTLFGGTTGDLYAQLTHSSGFAVLLNRVGRRTGEPLGYGDSGMNVRFQDNAENGDVHQYRLTLFGNHNIPLSGALSGTWAADGRTTDPDEVLDSDPRTALLSSFTGLDPNGSWTLFLGDMSPGGESTLTSWGLEITPVPEIGSHTGVFAVVCLLWALTRRRATTGRKAELSRPGCAWSRRR